MSISLEIALVKVKGHKKWAFLVASLICPSKNTPRWTLDAFYIGGISTKKSLASIYKRKYNFFGQLPIFLETQAYMDLTACGQ